MDELKRKQALSRGAMASTKFLAMFVVAVIGLPTTSAQAKDCLPSCRDGYLCHQGQCIAACNPPCAQGEQCVGEGQCVAATSTPTTQEATYTAVNTGGSVDSSDKPSVALPATFVGIGGFLLIAGGVTFGTGEWSGYYYESWGTGQYVGVGLMSLGAISLIVATPFLVMRTQDRRRWEREHANSLVQGLALAPILAPTARDQTYGVSLRGRF